MKLLENSALEALTSRISNGAVDCILDFKLESYSCKMVQSDKKQWKTVENGLDRQPLSPPDTFLNISASPIGHSARMRHLSEPSCSGSDNDGDELLLVDSISVRTLFDLRQVLNNAYSDYDFSEVKSDSFSLVPTIDDVITNVDSRFLSTVNDYGAIKDELWDLIENEIDPVNCRIYSYNTAYGGDPFSEDGCMWSLTYIFYSKPLKRILLFSCRALSQLRHDVSGEIWDDLNEPDE